MNVEFAKNNDAITFTAIRSIISQVIKIKLHIFFSSFFYFFFACPLISIRYVTFYRDGGNRRGRQKDYLPTMWNEHFDEKEDVIVDDGQTFRVYFAKRDKQNKKPLLVLLHGGGYSALTWAHFTVKPK